MGVSLLSLSYSLSYLSSSYFYYCRGAPFPTFRALQATCRAGYKAFLTVLVRCKRFIPFQVIRSEGSWTY